MIYYRGEVVRAGPNDLDRVRALLQDPDVSGTFGVVPDMEAALRQFVWLIFPGGAFGLDVRKNGSVWVHVAVLPWARGRQALEAARYTIRKLFKVPNVKQICGLTPSGLRAARMWNQMLGFTPRKCIDGHVFYSMTRQEYAKHGC